MAARGERIIRAGDKEITVLFTNRALADAEERMGRSIFGLVQGLMGGQTGMADIAELLRTGMQAARRDAGERPSTVSLDSAYAVLDTAGVTPVATILMSAIAAVLSYDPAKNGNRPEESDPN